ncbi:MAG: transposase [Candidatus Thermoplasmatota archaeon]|nr:transposase [Candidatus Thermoplasmatota archaeon]MBS3790594.1 transposase [Candidatus Thermoplasmatota archaeon]
MEYGPDHVRLFLSDCKNYSVAKIAQELKGHSSYIYR